MIHLAFACPLSRGPFVSLVIFSPLVFPFHSFGGDVVLRLVGFSESYMTLGCRSLEIDKTMIMDHGGGLDIITGISPIVHTTKAHSIPLDYLGRSFLRIA